MARPCHSSSGPWYDPNNRLRLKFNQIGGVETSQGPYAEQLPLTGDCSEELYYLLYGTR
jgi:hypothetical protein